MSGAVIMAVFPDGDSYIVNLLIWIGSATTIGLATAVVALWVHLKRRDHANRTDVKEFSKTVNDGNVIHARVADAIERMEDTLSKVHDRILENLPKK